MSSATLTKIEQINSQLKAKGYRKSKLRELIISYLQHNKAPLSALELMDKLLLEDLNPNKTSVYRELETLTNEHIIREVSLMDGKKRYELLIADRDAHSHLVCTECGSIECLEIDDGLHKVENKISNKHGFKIHNRILEFFGLCLNCSK